MAVFPMKRGGGSILATLAALRWFSAAAQAVAVAIVAFGFGVPLPLWPMAAAIAVLAAFNVYATRRARRESEPAAVEVFAHIAVDVAVLACASVVPFSKLPMPPAPRRAGSADCDWTAPVPGQCHGPSPPFAFPPIRCGFTSRAATSGSSSNMCYCGRGCGRA